MNCWNKKKRQTVSELFLVFLLLAWPVGMTAASDPWDDDSGDLKELDKDQPLGNTSAPAKPAAKQPSSPGDAAQTPFGKNASKTDADVTNMSASEKRRHADKLIARYRRAKTDAEQSRITTKLIAMGTPGPDKLLEHIGKSFPKAYASYLKLVEKSAQAALRKRGNIRAAYAKAKPLQSKALAITNRSNLTKSMIQSEIDPIVTQLEGMLRVTRDDLLADNKPLIKARNELLASLKRWHELTKHVKDKSKLRKSLKTPEQLATVLQTEEEFLAAIATPMMPAYRKIFHKNKALAETNPHQVTPTEANGTFVLNIRRVLLGLHPLALDLKITNWSRLWSKEMKNSGKFRHGPFSKNPGVMGENIAMGMRTGPRAIKGWWYSPGHHKNMLRKRFRRVGLGQEEKYWTQQFGN